MTPLTWQNVTIALGQLRPWDDNPKTLTQKQAKQLLASWEQLGQFATIAIGPNGEVYDGHQRLSVLLAAHGGGYQVEARQSSRPLTEQERRKIAIYSRQIGAWDWDILSGWEPAELTEWGFDTDLLADWRRDVAALGNFIGSEAIDYDELWQGMPEFEDEPKAARTLYIHFADNEAVQAFARLIDQDITDKTRSLWYPRKAENLHMDKGLVYTHES